MDNNRQRLLVSNAPGDTLAFMGWEVETADDLRHYAALMEAAGLAVHLGSRALADRRFVRSLIWFKDPMGNRLELFEGPIITSDSFKAGRPIDGFKTGAQGMGHNSFAMVGSGQQGFHHFMVVPQKLDDVDQGFDLAQLENNSTAYNLGRRTNDFMPSYYAHSPSGFFVESGWGGRVINPDIWTSHETPVGPSFWGHERLCLPEEEGRESMRNMRLRAAADGHRAAPIIYCPWLFEELAHGSSERKSGP